MKRILTLLFTITIMLSLAACGGENEEKSSGSIADIGGGGAQQSTGQSNNAQPSVPQSSTPQPTMPSETDDGVEVKDNTVIYKTNDGMGNDSIYEYIYKDGTLSAVNLTISCSDSATAQTVYDEMKSGSLKETTDAAYSSFALDGNRIICEMNEGMVAALGTLTQEQLVIQLQGGDPFSGSAAVGDNVNDGTTTGGETGGESTINHAWSDLSLPDGFPKLAEGVTAFSNDIEGLYGFQWDVMSIADCEAMAEKLEQWSGGTFEIMGDTGGKNWFLDTGKQNVTLTYYADTFGGVMPQVMLNVAVY